MKTRATTFPGSVAPMPADADGAARANGSTAAFVRAGLVVGMIAFAILGGLAGCGGDTAESSRESGRESGGSGAFAVEREAVKGPVIARVGLVDETITIADTTMLRILLDAREDVRLELPTIDEIAIEPFSIRDYEKDGPVLGDDGRLRATVSLEIEPFLSGDYELGPITVGFTLADDELGEDGAPKRYTIDVEPVPIRVESLTAAASAELDIRDLEDPAELEPEPSASGPPWVMIAAAAGVALTLLVLILRRMLGRRVDTAPVAPRRSPRESALAALDELEGRRLLEAGQVQEFYFEICAILREFIEGEFGLRAAEETTEEFLAELVHETRFDAETKDLLRRFLEHCDQVKFAKYAPGEDEIARTIEVTRSFVTRSSEPHAGQGAESENREVAHGV